MIKHEHYYVLKYINKYREIGAMNYTRKVKYPENTIWEYTYNKTNSRSEGLAIVNSFAWTFSLFAVAVVGVVVAVAVVVLVLFAAASVRTPGGERWSSREEMIGKEADLPRRRVHRRRRRAST